MINIRYHIVSITAIFLALGIGTLLGSTFLDRATVDQLDKNIRSAEGRIAETEARNSRLEEQVRLADGRDEALIQASGSLLDGQLTDQAVLIVTAPGVDQGTVDTLRLVLGNADADLRGTLALRDDLTSVERLGGDLAEALDLDDDDPEAVRAEVLDLLVEAMVAAGAPADPEQDGPAGEQPDSGTTTSTTPIPGGATTVPGDTTTTAPTTTAPTTTTTTLPDGSDPSDAPGAPDGRQPDVLTALVAADLVGIDPGPAYRADDPLLERTGYRYVFVTQSGLEEGVDDLLLELLPETETDPPLPAVVVSPELEEVPEGTEEPAPTAVARIRADAARSGLYDTVDDIDRYLGLASTVTILGEDEGTAAGHYGQGEGATALAPAGR